MYTDQYRWQRTVLGHTFTVSGSSCQEDVGNGTIVSVIRTWLRTHEEAQVMLASILVVVGLWWLVRMVLTLVISLVCPLLVVFLAVTLSVLNSVSVQSAMRLFWEAKCISPQRLFRQVCVPQLRTPLLGQNYPAMAVLLRNILLKMAENIKT